MEESQKLETISYEELTCEKKDGSAEIRLERTERRGSLTPYVVEELKEAFENHRSDSDMRAILLFASGDYFSVGVDIKKATSGLERRRMKDYWILEDSRRSYILLS